MSLLSDLLHQQGSEVGAYAYLTNQLGHYVLGAAAYQMVGRYYLLFVLAYLVLWEAPRWNGWDSVVDTMFVALGCVPAYWAIVAAAIAAWRLR